MFRQVDLAKTPQLVGVRGSESVRGAWVAQSVKRPTLAQVIISRSVGSSPA